MQNFPPVMGDRDKDVNGLKEDGAGDQKVNRNNLPSVIFQKRPPTLPLVGAGFGFPHVFGDRIVADIKSQFGQFALNPLRRPERIFLLKPTYQLDEFPVYLRSSDSPGFPPPVVFEAFAMPFDDGLRLDDK